MVREAHLADTIAGSLDLRPDLAEELIRRRAPGIFENPHGGSRDLVVVREGQPILTHVPPTTASRKRKKHTPKGQRKES